MICSACGGEVPESALSCPGCRSLIHAEKLEELARRATEAWQAGSFAEERALWAESLAMLPQDTVQHQKIAERVAVLDAQLAAVGTIEAPRTFAEKAAFLLAGLTSPVTFVSMLISLGVYWQLSNWTLAAGLVISIYIHEMGHLAMSLRYRVPATPPVFIPGLGAFIRLLARNIPPVVDSRVGLAGPIYGLGAAVGALALYFVTHSKALGLIAHAGADLNLLNLIPVWQLDGSRGIHSLTRSQRAIVAAVALGLFVVLRVRLLLVVFLVCIYRLFTRDGARERDDAGMMQFVCLLVALAVVVAIAPDASALLGGADSDSK